MAWLGDFLRFWWSLLYWNGRKSYFRLRHGRVRCPCQNPSDSGRGGETGCDAAQEWRRPARFRRVCPLLLVTPDGPRCSADARDVRPFWGRALAYFARAAAGVYVAGVLGAFVLMRVVGYPVSPLTLAWPPRWHEFRLARSEYFTAKAQRALAANRVSEAVLSLELAFRDNPRNYDAGFRLAQLMSLGQPEYADHVFALLMRDHPAQRPVTAQARLRNLLVHGRLNHAAELAAAQVVDNPAQRPAWLHVLFFATRHTGDYRLLRDLVARQPPPLQPIDTALINSELVIRQGRGLTLLPGLTTALPPEAGTYGPYYQVSRLSSLGRPAEALALLDRYAAAKRLPAADDFALRLDILRALGRGDLLCARLDQGAINSRELELVSAHLVDHPDPAVLAALARSVQRSKLPPDAPTCAAYTAYYVACGVAGDWEQAHIAAGLLKEAAGARMMGLTAVETFFRDRTGSARIESILPVLPTLPLDVIYSLYDRYDRPAPGVSISVGSPS